MVAATRDRGGRGAAAAASGAPGGRSLLADRVGFFEVVGVDGGGGSRRRGEGEGGEQRGENRGAAAIHRRDLRVGGCRIARPPRNTTAGAEQPARAFICSLDPLL